MNENRRMVESLNSRIAAALERIADALELQNEFAKARSKTAERVSRHNAKKKGVNLTLDVATEKKDEEKREERTKEEKREEEREEDRRKRRRYQYARARGKYRAKF